MFGKMMHQSLLISNLIEHAAKYHADTSIFSREVNGQITTTNWLQVQQNSKRLANAFTSFNLNQGDRLATIAWNNHRHLESWYAISGSLNPLPNDGHTQGNLQIRGPWIVDHYFNQEKSATTADGWFDTGDIATLDADGYMTICDRAKDLIKSGGEWISSVELENIAVGHPEIRMAAAIAARHPKWDERPILIAVRQENSTLTEEEALAYFDNKIARWQIPDVVIFVDALPINGTGKIVKAELRTKFSDVLLKEEVV